MAVCQLKTNCQSHLLGDFTQLHQGLQRSFGNLGVVWRIVLQDSDERVQAPLTDFLFVRPDHPDKQTS